MYNANAALPDSRAAEKARVMARDVIEYLDSIDFNKYYESLQKPSARTGEAQKMFLDFSLSSIRAAKVLILSSACLKCLPEEQLPASRYWDDGSNLVDSIEPPLQDKYRIPLLSLAT